MIKLKLALAALLMFFTLQSWADCDYTYYQTYQTGSASFGTVYVQRDTPAGTSLKTITASIGGAYGNLWICYGASWTVSYIQSSFPNLSSLGSNIFDTNVRGIGIRIFDTYRNVYLPVLNRPLSASQGYGTPTTFNIELVKTIDTGVDAGDLTPGALFYVSSNNTVNFAQVNLSGLNKIVPVACSIATPVLTFPIGDVLATKFGSTVGTIPSGGQNTQNLGLNCDAYANINVSLSGTQNPDVSTTSVLALTGQGNSDVAKGVGVQILYNGSPLVLNNRIVLKQSAGGQETFPLTVRYYQTKTTVSTGSANASATLNLTYQ